MKKVFYSAAVACLVFAACEDLEKDGTGSIFDNPILSDKPTTPLQPSEQKTKLESVARNFMDECSAEDFQKISGISEAFSNKFITDSYDFNAFYDWFNLQYETTWKGDYDLTISDGKVNITDSYDLLFLIANHKGHFHFGENAMTVDSSYNGLKATFSLDGKNYEAIIEQSGKVTDAIYSIVDKDVTTGNGYWNEETEEWVDVSSSTQVTNVWNFKITIGIPETLNISIKENGSPLAQVDAKFYPSLTASGIVPSKDSFSSEVTIKIDDYEYILQNLKYDAASGKASASQTLRKNGKTLLYSSVSGDVRIDTGTIKGEMEYGTYEYAYVEATLAKDITAAIDILGELQVIGTCSNALEANDAIEAFWDTLRENNPDEKTAQRHLDNFNAKFDFGVFYDKGNNRQADLEIEYLHNMGEEAGWDINGDGIVNGNDRYDDYYSLFPIIVFNDGSKNSIEEFFTEEAFGNLIEDFYNFCENFGEMFGFGFAEELDPVTPEERL